MELKRSRQFARQFDVINYYGTVKDLLAREELDAVVVVTPHNTHAEIVRASLEKGLAVFCEPPLGADYQETMELSRLAVEKKCVNMVNLVHRGSADLQKSGTPCCRR